VVLPPHRRQQTFTLVPPYERPHIFTLVQMLEGILLHTVWLNRGTACLWMLLILVRLVAFVARCTGSTLWLFPCGGIAYHLLASYCSTMQGGCGVWPGANWLFPSYTEDVSFWSVFGTLSALEALFATMRYINWHLHLHYIYISWCSGMLGVCVCLCQHCTHTCVSFYLAIYSVAFGVILSLLFLSRHSVA